MLRIRKANIDDCQLIHELAEQVFPMTYKDIITPEQCDFMMDWMYSIPNLQKQMLEDGHIYFLTSDDEGHDIGYISVQQQGDHLWHLQKIYVLPHYQGLKAGKFMFLEALKYIKKVHPEPCVVELNVNRNNKAVAFYEHMGMHKDRQGDFPIGNGFYMNDYIMAINI